MDKNEKQHPITLTSLNDFHDLASHFNHSIALNHLIKSTNYTAFIGVSVDEGLKMSDLALKDSSRSLVIDMNQETGKKYFLKHKDGYAYLTLNEAENLIILVMVSKDSMLVHKLYKDDYLQKKMD